MKYLVDITQDQANGLFLLGICPSPVKENEKLPTALQDRKINELDTDSRARNAFLALGIETLGDLYATGRNKIANFWGVGVKSLTILDEELEKRGLPELR